MRVCEIVATENCSSQSKSSLARENGLGYLQSTNHIMGFSVAILHGDNFPILFERR